MERDGGLLEAQGVAHRYGDVDALAGVTFSLQGGTTALVGVNGAGKTTLLSALAGALRPTTGEIRVAGHNAYRVGQRKAALSGVALMPQHVSFPGNMTAFEVVALLGWLRGMTHRNAKARALTVLEGVGCRTVPGTRSSPSRVAWCGESRSPKPLSVNLLSFCSTSQAPGWTPNNESS
jgi:ABC-type multidrug transport system ATPase subunit